MKNLFSVIGVFLLSLTTYTVRAQLVAGSQSYTISGRTFDVYTPNDYSASRVYPVVFELHGLGQARANMRDQKVVNEKQYIAVYPEGTEVPIIGGRAWNTWTEIGDFIGNPNDVAYLKSVYNKVKTEAGASFDANQVYLYGYSNGGAMAMKMLEESPGLFKGAVIRSMTLTEGHAIPNTASKVPMLFIHGVKDETVPYKGGSSIKYGAVMSSLKFMDVKQAVSAWRTHNGCESMSQDIHCLANGTLPEFWFREYRNNNTAAPVYLYAIPEGGHATEGFTNRNNKRTAMRLFAKPKCYGLFRKSKACQ